MNVHDTGPIEERRPQWPILVATDELEIRVAETQAEVEAAQRVRYRVFYEELGAVPTPAMEADRRDFDKYDPFCDHLLAIDRSTVDEDGQAVVMGCYRLLRNEGALRAGGFYTSGEFDISKLLNSVQKGTKLLELGRSCVAKEYRTKPFVVQLLWSGVMAYVARHKIDVMFGCASFPGTDPQSVAMPLSYLHHFHPMREDIRARALPRLYVDMNLMPKDQINPREGLHALPPLIKGYVRVGAQIGEGAVIDHQFSTTDVLIYVSLLDMVPRYRARFGLPDLTKKS
ncbi:MAG TPA: GNAT family N-acyltransferase [Rhizomicrobium sp.]